MNKTILIAGLALLSLQAFATENERDCRRGRIIINQQEYRMQMNEAIDELNQIPGVAATCGELPAGTHPRMGGGF